MARFSAIASGGVVCESSPTLTADSQHRAYRQWRGREETSTTPSTHWGVVAPSAKDLTRQDAPLPSTAVFPWWPRRRAWSPIRTEGDGVSPFQPDPAEKGPGFPAAVARLAKIGSMAACGCRGCGNALGGWHRDGTLCGDCERKKIEARREREADLATPRVCLPAPKNSSRLSITSGIARPLAGCGLGGRRSGSQRSDRRWTR
jgi:hypothetical protein